MIKSCYNLVSSFESLNCFIGRLRDASACRLVAFATSGTRSSLAYATTPLNFKQDVHYTPFPFSREEFDELKDKLMRKSHYDEIQQQMFTKQLWDRIYTMTQGHTGLSTYLLTTIIFDLPGRF